MAYYMVVDAEAHGLTGPTFAVGYVVFNERGDTAEEGLMACNPDKVEGGWSLDRDWVRENVPQMVYAAKNGLQVREWFWKTWLRWKARGATLWADCLYPVEATLLLNCIADNPHTDRAFDGPYPFHEIATLALACGRNPTADYDRMPDELPKHNPLCDARQSARILKDYLDQLELISELGV